jgi:hypothetical protein
MNQSQNSVGRIGWLGNDKELLQKGTMLLSQSGHVVFGHSADRLAIYFLRQFPGSSTFTCCHFAGLFALGEKLTSEQLLDWLPDRWLLNRTRDQRSKM